MRYSSATLTLDPRLRVIVAFVEQEGLATSFAHNAIKFTSPMADSGIAEKLLGNNSDPGIFRMLGVQHVAPQAIIDEMLTRGLIRRVSAGLYEFADRYGTTLKNLSLSLGVELSARRDLTPDDYGVNDERERKASEAAKKAGTGG